MPVRNGWVSYVITRYKVFSSGRVRRDGVGGGGGGDGGVSEYSGT